jgi:hypothetical protein
LLGAVSCILFHRLTPYDLGTHKYKVQSSAMGTFQHKESPPVNDA